MEKMRIVAAIIVYNKEISTSITYRNIRSISNNYIEILIIDNSTIKTKNRQYCNDNKISYISMKGNKGLSKAYNVAVDKSIEAEAIVLLDDDTEVTEEYFIKLINALKTQPDIDIFAPIIYGQDGVIYSPNEFNFLRNHFISNPDQKVSQDSFNAIASCLAIRMRVFATYRFNEKLFVDQVDQFFFCEQRKRGTKFGKLDVSIKQNFYQRGTTLSPQAGWKRLKLRIIDIMRHARLMENSKYLILGYIKCCGLGVQIGKKSHSLKVIFKAVIFSTKVLLTDI